MKGNTLKVLLCRIRYYVVIVGFSGVAGGFWGALVVGTLRHMFDLGQRSTLFAYLAVSAVIMAWAWKKVPIIWKLEKDDCWKEK